MRFFIEILKNLCFITSHENLELREDTSFSRSFIDFVIAKMNVETTGWNVLVSRVKLVRITPSLFEISKNLPPKLFDLIGKAWNFALKSLKLWWKSTREL